MDAKIQDWKEYIDEDTGCLCRYVKSTTEPFRAHSHNYYELFMMVQGTAHHIVNGHRQRLSVGQLLFIRDFDVHDYQSADGGDFAFINLAVTHESISALFDYLGEGFPSKALLNAPTPPLVNLSENETKRLTFSFTELNDNLEKTLLKLKVRVLLMTIFTKYFINYSREKVDVPLWLDVLYEKMQDPKNFSVGVERMFELSGKTREHLTRSLKRYYGTTPTNLITELRLNYASNLLLTSNLTATNICYECGFESLSWFYKAFSQKFMTTPTRYRKRFKA